MKSIGRSILVVLLAAAPAIAQPQPPPEPPIQPPGETPSWLPGVEDVTGKIVPTKVTLTLDKALELAVQQQPSLRQAKAATEAAFGKVDLARVAQHVTVTLTGALGTSSEPVRFCDMTMTTTCGGFFSPQVTSGLGASATYRITDFGLTDANVRSAQATAEATAATVDTNVLDIRKAVESAYLQAVARDRLIKVAEATVKSEEGHLDQAKRFVAAQAHDPIEVAQAVARLANAKSALAQAQSNQALALATLRSAIGWLDPTQLPIVDPNWPEPPTKDPPQLPALVELARAHRPEIIQFDKQIVSADASLEAAHAERRPILAATATSNWGPGTGDWDPQPTWAAGLTLTWAALDGGKSAADVRVAKANISLNLAERDALLVQLTSDLDSARSQIVANRANVQASDEAVVAAQAQLKLADARYIAGLGSQIELADAQTAVTTAEGNLVLAQFQLADAWAQLKRALGQV